MKGFARGANPVITIADLPMLNAALNGTSALLLTVGYLCIRRKKVMAHSHTILAAAIVPLALVTLSRALKGRFRQHVSIARRTLPIWLYVSITGVMVYWMLYQLYPSR